MQNEHRSSQPFIVVTNAVGAPDSTPFAVRKRGLSVSNTVRAAGGEPSAISSSRRGSSGMLSGPTTRSIAGMRLRSFSPSCCATHPATTSNISRRARFCLARRPTSLRSFCSAFSRTLHVLRTTMSASASASTRRNPAPWSTSSMRCESWTFIWQPNVVTAYVGLVAMPDAVTKPRARCHGGATPGDPP